MTLDEAIELLHAIAHHQAKPIRLNRSQLQVFEGSWNGKSYQEIADEFHLNHEYVKQIGAKLWSMLSRALGEPVGKLNLQSVMTRYAQARSIQPVGSTFAEILEGDVGPTPIKVRHNLPGTDYHVLVGREAELFQLLDLLLSDKTGACISVVGQGGIGKTALALAAAYWCLQTQTPTFEAIIFASAKQHRLTTQTILPRSQSARNLRDIFRAIACVLQRQELLRQTDSTIEEAILESLSQQRSLLIVDNLETVDDVNAVLAFLHELPYTTKAIITSRSQTPFPLIRLQPLEADHSLSLIRKQAELKAITINGQNSETLLRQTSGIPAAIVYAVGQLAVGYRITHIPQTLTLSGSDYCRFYFESSVNHLKSSLSYELLMALALFAESAPLDALVYTVNASPEDVFHGLVHLQRISLIYQHDERFSMLPLTQEYVLNELSAHPEQEAVMRDRWIDWYLAFAQEYGGKDWKDWNDFSEFEPEWENLRDAIQWCVDHDRYNLVRQFWHQVKAYTHSLGYRGDRLTYWAMGLDWATWLLNAAEQRQDWATALEIMADQSWTLTLLDQPDQAAELYAKAWALRQHKDAEFQANLAIHTAYLLIKQTQWDDAATWLNTAEQLIIQSAQGEAKPTRSQIELAYYRGTLHYKLKQYDDAQQIFEKTLKLAQSIHWQRAIYLIQDFLADIAIAQDQLSNAETLLAQGLKAAIANQDECRMAYCQRSLARLEWQRNNSTLAVEYAIAAQQRFVHLGMQTEAQETADLLQTLSA